MIITIITAIIAIALGVIVALTFNMLEDYYTKRNKVSFKSNIDILGMPVVTIQANNTNLNLLIDTGAETSILSTEGAIVSRLAINPEKAAKSLGADGVLCDVFVGDLKFTLKKEPYEQVFWVRDSLDAAFASILKDEGIQIHGLLGSDFFNSNNYVIDYKDHILYKKRSRKNGKHNKNR